MVARVSTFTFTNRLNTENLRIQNAASQAQLQISSGRVGTSYEDIGRQTQRLLNTQNDLSRIETQNITAETTGARVQQQFSTLGIINDLANNVISSLTQSLGGPLAVPEDVERVALANLESLESLLNVNFGGRFLFSGSEIDVPPVDISDPAFTPQPFPSVANTGYYQGDDILPSSEISDGFVLTYGVTADDPAFEKLFRALSLAANNSTNGAARQEALDLINESVDGIGAIQVDLAARATIIQDQIESNQNDINIFTDVISDIQDTDLAEASLRLTLLQTQLEASFATTARTIGLRLFDFI